MQTSMKRKKKIKGKENLLKYLIIEYATLY